MIAAPNPATATLPAVLDLQAAAPLADQLMSWRGRPLRLDASQVERLGGLCLQVLLSARAAWAADAQSFAISSRSAAFDEALTLFGAVSLVSQQEASS